MLRLKAVTQFKRDLKRFKYDKKIQEKLEEIIHLLVNEKKGYFHNFVSKKPQQLKDEHVREIGLTGL